MTRFRSSSLQWFSILQLSVSFVIVAVLLQSCTQAHSEQKSAAHRDAALRYLANRQLKEALLEFKNAARYAPQDSAIQYQIALISLQFEEPTFLMEAYEALRRAVDLNPDNKDAQLKLGALYLLSQKPADARACAEAILRSDPTDPEGLSLRGHSYLREGRLGQGLADLKRVIELRPSNVKFYIDLARAYVQMNMLQEAGATLEQALAIEPDSVDVQLSLADYHFLNKRMAEAEAYYRRALALAPSNESIYLKTAEFYQTIYRWKDAENALRRVVSLRPDSARAYVILGEFHAFLEQHDAAIAAFEAAVDKEPNSLSVRSRYIAGLLDAGRIDEAERLIGDLEKRSSPNPDIDFLSGRVFLVRGDISRSRDFFERVVRNRPWFAPAHHYLGLIHARQDDLVLARQELTESLRLDPKNVKARLALAMVYFRDGSYDLAVEQAARVLQANPGYVHAAIIASDCYMATGQSAKASAVLQQLAVAVPDNPQVEYRLGLLSLSNRNQRQALSHFEAALRMDVRFIEPLQQIGNALFEEGKKASALERVRAQLVLTPDHAALHRYHGDLLYRVGYVEQAEAAYKKAIELDDRNLGAYVSLGKLYQAQGRVDDAIVEYETVLRKDAKLNSARMLLAISYEQKQDYQKAKAYYDEIIKRDPRHGPAANNLAVLLVQEGGNLDLALSYAQTARETMPQDPLVADTLGWIYYHKKAFKRAVNLLREASEGTPSNAIVQYHFGMALLNSGQKQEARKILERSLVLDKNFAEARNARATLAGI